MILETLNLKTVVAIQLRRSSMRAVDQLFYHQALSVMLQPFAKRSVREVTLDEIQHYITSLSLEPTMQDCYFYIAKFFDDWRNGVKSSPSDGVYMRCPKCQARARLTNSRQLYQGNDFGSVYLCENYPHDCDAYVGVHQGDNLPLGAMSSMELKCLRRSVQRLVDPLWQRRNNTRSAVYHYLARKMDLATLDCQINKFDDAACRKALALRPKLMQKFFH